MATIFLIRHGEPEITGVLAGQLDPPLSASGREHARKAFASLRPQIVWTSPLRRAAETAALIPKAEIHQLPELREIDMGAWTGLTWRQVEDSWGDLASKKLANWFAVPAPGGESWLAFLSRVGRAWSVIRRGPSNAAIVAHEGVHAALCYLIDGRDPAGFEQQYCEVTSLDYNPVD